jgi:hypothetical protein
MLRYIPAVLWTLALYAATAATAGQAVVPQVALDATAGQIWQARLLFELKHVIMHAAAYGALAGLLMIPHGSRKRSDLSPACLVVFCIVLTIGAGQELIQTLIRWDLRPGNSLLDIISNGAGAMLGLWLGRVFLSRRPLTYHIGAQHKTRVQ